MKKCVSCGYNNLDDRSNCAQCGYWLGKSMKVLATILLFFAVSCTSKPIKEDKIQVLLSDTKNADIFFINREIKPYADRVVSMANAFNKPFTVRNFVINFKEKRESDDAKSAGYCTKIYNTPVIIIFKDEWNSMGDAGKESLVLHEMLHCFSSRNHCNDMHEGVEVSVMNETLPTEDAYIRNREYYIIEAFHPHPLCKDKVIKWLE